MYARSTYVILFAFILIKLYTFYYVPTYLRGKYVIHVMGQLVSKVG
jgi:hypothetical protein